MIALLSAAAYVLFCALIWPLTVVRFLFALACVALMIICAQPASASGATFCDSWSSTAAAMLDVRQRGLDKASTQEILEDAGVWNIPIQYALDHAFQVDEQQDREQFRREMFKACREDDV